MLRPWALAVMAPALLLTSPSSAAAPAVYDVHATAVGTRVQSIQSPPVSIVTGGLVDSTAAFAASSLSSATAPTASASAAYPGDLIAGGPGLLCSQLFPCPAAPPPYPLLAQASWPDAPDGTATGASAHTRADRSSAEAVARSTVAGSTAAVQRAWTHSWVDAQGAHAEAASEVDDLVVGVLRIKGLASRVRVDVSAQGAIRSRPSVHLAEVTVAGRAVTVDGQGLHAPAAVRTLLDAQGISIALVESADERTRGAARVSAGGLRITVSAPVRGVPVLVPGLPTLDRTYQAVLTVGGAGVAVSAAGVSVPFSLGPLPAPPGSLPAVQPPGGSGSATLPGPVADTSTGPAVAGPVSYLLLAIGEPFTDFTPIALMLLGTPGAVLLWRATRLRGRS